MITVTNLNKSYGGDSILENVSFRILPKDRIGFIGSNGAGKTTLLKILAGHEEYDSGSIVLENPSMKISLLSQLVTLKPYNKVADEMKLAVSDILGLEAEIRAVEEDMNLFADDPEKLDEAIKKYGVLLEKYEHMNGDDISWETDKILLGLGFSLSDKDRYVSEFSGGWKMRLEFAKLLLRKSDLLMLDEPTNHLDMHATEWLENYLASYPGAIIAVSHDRYFLNRISAKTLYLANRHVKLYTGNYDSFVKQKDEEEELLYKKYKEQQKMLEHDLHFIERFRYKATLATRVKSREKMLAKKQLIEAPMSKEKQVHVNFDFDSRQMTKVMEMHDIEKHFDSLTVSLHGDIEINAGERIAFIGENGCGKSTLFNIISGHDRKYIGKLKVHPAANIKYYYQNQDISLIDSNTAFQEMERVAPNGMTVTEIRTRLAAFLFFGDDVFKTVSVLSGGERARLSLAMLLCSSANVIMLDEPTNHLDIPSREALSEALNSFEGTVLIVSHDRYFIDQVCDRVIEIKDGRMESYMGNYSWYLTKKQQLAKKKEFEEKSAKRNSENKPIVRKSIVKPKAVSIEKMIKEKEKEIERAELRLKTTEELMSDPDIASDLSKISKLSEDYGKISEEIEKLFAEYEELTEQLENQ